jgi:hypothetical protein
MDSQVTGSDHSAIKLASEIPDDLLKIVWGQIAGHFASWSQLLPISSS